MKTLSTLVREHPILSGAGGTLLVYLLLMSINWLAFLFGRWQTVQDFAGGLLWLALGAVLVGGASLFADSAWEETGQTVRKASRSGWIQAPLTGALRFAMVMNAAGLLLVLTGWLIQWTAG